MDKYEYQVCADQIKSLLAERKYTEAMEIADAIDWRRVKSVSMLCTVSEIYKINKRYEESRDILLLAYERYPNGRMIVYALCELAIKMDDILQAVEYYKEFVQVAPGDTGSYILLYKIYEAQDVSLEERIEVLKEFKKRDYREKWAYELAYLYHKTGQETNCIAECDELILWFGEGRYVKKAMELKMEHTGLSTEQQLKYEGRQESATPGSIPAQMPQEPDYGMEHIQVQPVNTGKFSTMNLQEELARSMEEFLTGEDTNVQAPYYGQVGNLYESAQTGQDYRQVYEQPAYGQAEQAQQMYGQPAEEPQGMYEPPVTEASRPVYEPQGYGQSEYEQQGYDRPEYEQPVYEQQEYSQPEYEQPAYEQPAYGQAEQAQQMYGQPAEEPQGMYEPPVTEASRPVYEPQGYGQPGYEQQEYDRPVHEQQEYGQSEYERQEYGQPEYEQPSYEQPAYSQAEQVQQTYGQPSEEPQEMYEPPVAESSRTAGKKYDAMLSQEYDGQISLSLPDTDMVEKQITGQINLNDVLKGWEEKKEEIIRADK